jgi:hypothetical protein
MAKAVTRNAGADARPRSWVAVTEVSAAYSRRNGSESGRAEDEHRDWPVLSLGTSGVCFESSGRLKVGDGLSVSIHLPDTRNFIIAPAEVTEVAEAGHFRRISCTFSEMPVPLMQRVRKVMREFNAERGGREQAEMADEVASRLNGLVVNQEVFIDVLELSAMGVNLNEVNRARELNEPEPESAAPRIPIYEFDSAGGLRLDEHGAPAGEPVDHLQLPVGEGDESFGCQCLQRIDAFPGLSFNKGSILIFSYSRQPQDCEVILCPLGSRGLLGKIYEFRGAKALVFHPSGGKTPPVVLDCSLESAGYRLIARYERL